MGYPLIYGLSIHEYSRRDVFRLLVRTVKISQYVPSIVFFQKVSSSSASKWKGYEKCYV